MSRKLFDSALFWVAFGGAVSAIGIGVVLWTTSTAASHKSPSEPRFALGIGVTVVGAGALLWGLVLLLAHRYAEHHIAPNSQRVMATEAAPDATTLARLRELQQEAPALHQAIDMAYGQQAILNVRRWILAWCLSIEQELQSNSETLWKEFRERNMPPGMSDRTVGQGLSDPERHWDHIDSVALRGFLRQREEALGYALACLEKESSGGDGNREGTSGARQ